MTRRDEAVPVAEWFADGKLRGKEFSVAVNRNTAGATDDAPLIDLLEADVLEYDEVLENEERLRLFFKRLAACGSLASDFESYIGWANAQPSGTRRGSKLWKMTRVRRVWLMHYYSVVAVWTNHDAREGANA